jgi:Glycerol-3-phosphate dehydrogenase
MIFPVLDMATIANNLRLRRRQGIDTVLVLGSRTGSFFHSQYFRETLLQFSDPSFAYLSPAEQFSASYQLLTKEDLFTSDVIDTILTRSLQEVSPADLCLAELIRLGLFQTIVSTNVDGVLERALELVGMQSTRDFDVYSFDTDERIERVRNMRADHCRIIKVFGSIASNNHTINRQDYLVKQQKIAGFLRQVLHDDILSIGLDPYWDAELYRVFPVSEKAWWFVNDDEQLLEAVLPESIKSARLPQCYTAEEQGRYKTFIHCLYALIVDGANTDLGESLDIDESRNRLMTQPSMSSLTVSDRHATGVTGTGDQQSDSLPIASLPLKLFIIYPAREIRMFMHLKVHMSSLLNEDQRLLHLNGVYELPENIYATLSINERIKNADLILLLVSAHFLHYYYYKPVVLQDIIKQQQSMRVRVIPIILRPADWDTTPLGVLNSLPTNGKPITEWRNRDSAFLDVVNGIRAAIDDLRRCKR